MYKAEKSIVIVGGGAAGLFAAVCLKERLPLARVCVVEAGGRALSKLRLTGGGRCNLTHTFEAVEALGEVYPRGERLLRKLFYRFGPQDTWRWFEERGLRLYAQSDGRVFPRSDRADEVADLLLRLASERGVELCEGTRVERIERSGEGWRACLAGGRRVEADAVLVATGGSPRREALERLLEGLPVELVAPVPSLFAFNVADGGLRALSGTTLADARLRLAGTKWQARGALLLTHFGLSGPAVLRLSSYAARHLTEAAYRAPLLVNWLPDEAPESLAPRLRALLDREGAKQLSSVRPEGLNTRLWLHLLERSGLDARGKCAEVSRKQLNGLVTTLTQDEYLITGRAPHKDEFVTCGGVSLKSLQAQTLEVRSCSGLYVAGEALDVDAVTGGFNLQAAWTTAYVCAESIIERFTQPLTSITPTP